MTTGLKTIATALAVLAATALFSMAPQADDGTTDKHKPKTYVLAVTTGPNLQIYQRATRSIASPHASKVLICAGVYDVGIVTVGTTCRTQTEHNAGIHADL